MNNESLTSHPVTQEDIDFIRRLQNPRRHHNETSTTSNRRNRRGMIFDDAPEVLWARRQFRQFELPARAQEMSDEDEDLRGETTTPRPPTHAMVRNSRRGSGFPVDGDEGNDLQDPRYDVAGAVREYGRETTRACNTGAESRYESLQRDFTNASLVPAPLSLPSSRITSVRVARVATAAAAAGGATSTSTAAR